MSNDIDLRLSRSFELCTRLKDIVFTFTKKETQFSADLRNRKAQEARKTRDATAAIEKWLLTETTKAETQFSETEVRAHAVYETRRDRIQRAHGVNTSNLLKQAKREKDRWLEKLQLRHFMATRSQPEDLATAETTFSAHSAKLAQQRTTLLNLQRQTRRAFFGYLSFWKLVRPTNIAMESAEDYAFLSQELDESLQATGQHFFAFRKYWIPQIFSYLPLFITLPVIVIIAATLTYFPNIYPVSPILADSIAGILAVILIVLHFRGASDSRAAAKALADSLEHSTGIYSACAARLGAEYETELSRITKQYENTFAEIDEQWAQADQVEKTFAEKRAAKIEHQEPRALAKNESLLHPKLQHNTIAHDSRIAQINTEAELRKQQTAEAHETEMAGILAEETAGWAELEATWNQEIIPLYQDIAAMDAAMEKYAPPWTAQFAEQWEPPTEFPPAAKFAALRLDLMEVGALPTDPRLTLPGPSQISIPLALTFPGQGSLLFEAATSGEHTVTGTLNNIILRILSTTPPGKLTFTVIDPVGLGQNFAGLMHLADFEESLINRRIWTQHDQIDERLSELNEHIEKVIQMYLRNEYATITEYNAQAGSVAEKYHFLVIADFPANFSETAIKRLQSIAVSGPQCGVFTLIHWDTRQAMPDGFVAEELKKNSVCIRHAGNNWLIEKSKAPAEAKLVFDVPPEPAIAVDLVHKIGKSSIDSNRVEVPFRQIAPGDEEMWQNETTTELRVPIGRTGATKLQYLALGKGTRQHALFAGKTGSGKSTLFHVIITNLALTYSPDQVEFYLIDFKKGVEFKCYATHRLPHAKVVAIESDREFGLSVLQRVDEELKRRGDLFRNLGVQDIAGYKRVGGKEPMPRSLLIIDEFQEFFVQDDQIAQTASLLFDRIVRQGRAFGIHVLLGSQTLGGAYTLARATLGQMVVRVALQCNEADAYLIMDDNNPAPRLLSRPGEGIYNDAAGALEGNSPFQVVWLPDEERDSWLEKVHTYAKQHGDKHRGPIVFEGNAPADIRENELLYSALLNVSTTAPASGRMWLGAPNSIKGPTEVAFQRQSGNNLLMVGQREEAILTMLGASLLALAAQYPRDKAKFFVFHSPNPGSTEPDFLEKATTAISQNVTRVQSDNLTEVMNELSVELATRSAGTETDDAPEIFVFIPGLQKFKKLRHEDDFDFSGSDSEPKPGAQLNTLLTEGSSHGIHLIVTLDTFNNVSRFLSRKALTEFEMRVVFQMSANDSASLIDSGQASNLGLHRALFYNERDGYLETFRPYATPDSEWIQQTTQKLSTR
ncbi:MAG: FtsK/SpoIIIE domain-containing protein [Chthoniobacterales bacterium]